MPVVPEDLQAAYREGNLIVCVGPQLSCAAGLPSPVELARQLLEVAAAHDVELDRTRLGAWIERGRLAEVLGLLEGRLGATFQREVELRLSDRDHAVPELAVAIAALHERLRAVYTTGLDRLLERAFAGRWPSFATARADLAQRRAIIFKLRGTLEFAQSWVLTREQQERELGSRSLRQSILEAAFQAHQILFLGFGADDEDLRRLLDAVAGPAPLDQGPSHFIVLPACAREEREALERWGVQAIRDDAVALLRALGGASSHDAESSRARFEGCPYLGLETFEEKDAALFFGRQAEVSQAASRLGGFGHRHRRWLSIEGPSGVGKSSFAQAGVVPALRRGFAVETPARWRVLKLRPGAHPVQRLAHALHHELELPQGVEAIAEGLAADRHALARHLEPRGRGHGILLVADQLEELVTLTCEPERSIFAESLAHALEAGVLYLVSTIRSDFVPAFQRLAPALAGLLNEGAERYALPPISRVGLREAIVAPARLAGVQLAPTFVERLVLDADELGGAGPSGGVDGEALTHASTLPLVAHVLRGLWDARYHEDQRIELSEYEQMGGLSGALSCSADGVLEQLTQDERAQAKALLLRLVRVNEQGPDTRRTLTREDAVVIAGERVLLMLSGKGESGTVRRVRLLVVHDDGEQVVVDLVHEALLRQWRTLRGWIDQDRVQLGLDTELAERAEAWEAQGRSRHGLPQGRALTRLLQGRPHGARRALHEDYLRRLRRTVSARRMAWAAVAGGITLISLAVTLVVLGKNFEIEQQRDELQRSSAVLRRALSIQHGLRARSLIPEDREGEALLLGVQAVGAFDPQWQLPPPHEAMEGLLRVLVDDSVLLEDQVALQGRVDDVQVIAYSPSGTHVATGSDGGQVAIWDAYSGALVALHDAHEDSVWAVAYSPDGAGVVTASFDGTAMVWDGVTGQWSTTLEGHESAVVAVAYSPDGARIATASTDDTARIWNASTGDSIRRLEGHTRAVSAVAYSPDGARLATASLDATAKVWNAETGELVTTLEGHTDLLRAIAYSPDGSTIATASDDRTARLWRESGGEPLEELQGHADVINQVAYSPDGAMLVTVSDDRTARVWDTATGEPLTILRGHTRAVQVVAYGPDGSQVATGSWDGTARIWDPRTGDELATLRGGSGRVQGLAHAPDGALLAVATWGDAVRVVSTALERPLVTVRGHTDFV
ncbi:MAG: SIR2 family protein, partial [Myxococcales bacterium]|nr:SIR2 family protein [Myxococcales bacterium]